MQAFLIQAKLLSRSLGFLLRLIGLIGLVGLIGAGFAAAQSETDPSSPTQRTWFATPILTLNQARLLEDSKAARKIEAARITALEDLAEENRQIDADLEAEEKDLTQRRTELQLDEFKKLANEFNQKVIALRTMQSQKTTDINQKAELERRKFLERVLPILGKLAQENGALVIMDTNDFILSANAIDITDTAITRINAAFAESEGKDNDEPQ